MNKLIYITFYILLNINFLNILSQENQVVSNRDRFVFGGSFGIMLGTYSQIEISPYIGYRITAPWMVGAGVIYQYYGASHAYGNFSTSIYGTNLFTKYTLIRDFPSKGLSLFTYTGYEMLSLENEIFGNLVNQTGRFWMHSLLIGGGLRQYLGGRASAELQILYNMNQLQNSPYNNPIIRIAINL